MKKCITFYFRGKPYLVHLEQGRKNFKKYLRGRLPDHEVKGSGTVVEHKEVIWLIRKEQEKISKQRKGYPERGRPIEARGRARQ